MDIDRTLKFIHNTVVTPKTTRAFNQFGYSVPRPGAYEPETMNPPMSDYAPVFDDNVPLHGIDAYTAMVASVDAIEDLTDMMLTLDDEYDAQYLVMDTAALADNRKQAVDCADLRGRALADITHWHDRIMDAYHGAIPRDTLADDVAGLADDACDKRSLNRVRCGIMRCAMAGAPIVDKLNCVYQAMSAYGSQCADMACEWIGDERARMETGAMLVGSEDARSSRRVIDSFADWAKLDRVSAAARAFDETYDHFNAGPQQQTIDFEQTGEASYVSAEQLARASASTYGPDPLG